jgi:hypothetical protein
MTIYLPIGTISEGTLVTEDLLDAFANALEHAVMLNGLVDAAPMDAVREARLWTTRGGWASDPSIELADEIITRLEDAIAEFLPPYCYFGAAEGDGACFGVWPIVNQLEADARYRDDVTKIDAGNERPDASGTAAFVMEVNDHGNVTLLESDGTQWVECWSIV